MRHVLHRVALTLVAALVVALGAAWPVAPSAAAASAARTVGSVHLQLCCAVDVTEAATGLAVLETDGNETQGMIERFDPATGHRLASVDLGGPPISNRTSGPGFFNVADLVVADGSLWVAMYFQDLVYRLDPVTLRIEAVVPTGRTPVGLAYGAGSLWTALSYDRAVDRIDPVHNTVVTHVPVGRQDTLSDGPRSAAWDGHQLLVPLPGSGRVAHVSAAGRTVGYDRVGTDAAACAAIEPVPGGYWLDDTDCGIDFYRWDDATHRLAEHIAPAGSWGAAYVQGALYVGDSHCGAVVCRRGFVEKRDPTTGALIATRRIGGQGAWVPAKAFGSLWVADTAGTLRRVPAF